MHPQQTIPTPKSFWQRLRVATFSDVPSVLDNIWRHYEFRLNRLGRVSYRAPEHLYQPLGTTPWAFFPPYVVISSFLVFGPTFTTLCTSFGRTVAEGVRIGAGVLLLALTVFLTYWLSSAIISCLAYRAAHQLRGILLRTENEADARSLAELFGSVIARITHPEVFVPQAWVEITGLSRAFRDFIVMLVSLDRNTRDRFETALFLLFMGVAVVVLPFLAAGIYLVSSPYDPDVCGRHHDTWRGLAQIGVFASLVLGGAWLWYWKRPSKALMQLLCITCFWVLAMLLLDLLVAGPSGREADGGPYPQTYLILLGCLIAVMLAARPFAHRVFRGVPGSARRAFRRELRRTELFDDNGSEPDPSKMRIAAAFINGLMYHPLHLLLFPSLVAITLPSRDLLYYVCLAFAVTWLLLAHGNIAARWEALIAMIDRWFLSGTPLLVSLLVMTLAIARLLQFQYVATLLDAAPFGIIFVLVVTAYSTLWFFEYWINRWAAEALLAILGTTEQRQNGNRPYLYRPPQSQRPVVELRGRNLAIHGTGQFCVQGLFLRQVSNDGNRRLDHAFTTYRLLELFERLGRNLPAEIVNDVERRTRFFYACINAALLLILGGLLSWQQGFKAPLAAFHVIDANDQNSTDGYSGDLHALLARQANEHQPALIIAASGGGTRAARYTATALEGLAKIQQARNIVLLSGVSGGGVAAAYFASDFERLKKDYQKKDWDSFKHIVTEPFIEDVLDGAGELRIAGNVPLGELLAESFDRRVFTGRVTQFKDLSGPALILNTSISGHPWEVSEVLKDRVGVIRAQDSCLQKSQLYSSLAGGRLVFTNLANIDGFPQPPMIMPDVGLIYKIVRDPNLPLARAAALNANFPPVFSNARVRLAKEKESGCSGYSYFVTDGGATENLGLVSALYALRGVLDSWNHEKPGSQAETIPQIDIVAVEASAITYDYDEDRGIGALAGGSKERINGALTEELIRSINQRLEDLGAPKLRLHYLPLPLAFRSRGGFGTHWMYADEIRVSNPLLPVLRNPLMQWLDQQISHRWSSVVLKHEDIDQLWTALFDPKVEFCRSSVQSGPDNVARVAAWICGKDNDWDFHPPLPDLNVCAWRQLVNDVSDPKDKKRESCQQKTP